MHTGREGCGLTIAVTFQPAHREHSSTTKSSESTQVLAGCPQSWGGAEIWADYWHSHSRCRAQLQEVYTSTFVSTALEGHPSQLPVFSQLRQVQQQHQAWSVHTTGGTWHHRAHVLVGSSWGGIHSGSIPSRSIPVPPTSHHSLEPNLMASGPTTGEEHTLPPTGLWQPQSKEEAPSNIQCRLWSQHQSHPLFKGITVSTHWGKTHLASIPKTTLAPKVLDSHRQHRGAPT